MRVIKSLLDRVLALGMILILSPLIILVSLYILIRMGGPILFTQNRPGLNGRIFLIFKFRTMTNKRDSKGELLPDSERITSIGKIIRSLSLDELPQLYNILRGEMSFVGPRPLLPEYLSLYSEEQARRHNVKPGITGWAQVNGRNSISWKEKFELDVWYVENWSLLLDIKIFFLTALKVLKRSDVNQSQNVTMSVFNGKN